MPLSTEQLTQDLRAVIGEAEELLKATAGQTGERIEKIRTRAEESVRMARERLESAGHDLNGRVQDNPWAAVGVAAGIGLIAGILLSRK